MSALAASYNGTVPAAPALAIMAAGVVVAVLGHIWRSYRVVAVGVAILFLATVLMLISAFIAFHRGEKDPRPAPDFISSVVR